VLSFQGQYYIKVVYIPCFHILWKHGDLWTPCLYSMDQSSSEAFSSSASQEITCILWNPFCGILFNTIHPFMPRSYRCFPSCLSIESLYAAFLSAICVTYLAYVILCYFITQVVFGVEYKSWSSSSCNFLMSLLTFSSLGPNIFFSVLFLKIRSHCLPVMWDQVSHQAEL